MDSSSNKFVLFFTIYFQFYFVISLLSQALLLVLILKKSPKSLESLKYFLFNTLILQVLVIFCAYFSQHRSLPNSTTFAVLSFGPCRKFGSNVCFSAYHIFLGLSFAIALSISNTILFRYLVMKRNSIEKREVLGIIGFSYIPVSISWIVPFTAEWNFEIVQTETRSEHPTYDLSIYEPFPGFADIKNIQFLGNTALLTGGAYAVPAICALFTRTIIKLIKSHTSMSEKTKKQAKTLLNGLTCQTLMPIICYIPVLTCYYYSQITGNEVILTEHLLCVTVCLPSLVDPFLCFYFIVPYRQVIIDFFKCRKTLECPSTFVSVSQVSARNPGF